MDLMNELNKYTDLVPIDKLKECMKRPASLCPGEFKYLIPSIIMGSDGPVLQSLFLVTDNSICEVRLIPQSESFDFCALNMVLLNYRFAFSELIVKKEGEADLKYEVAQIVLKQGFTGGIESTIRYVGFDREAWIKQVIEAFPISMILNT